ncbi:MAG: PepSY domain-containing protein [Chitinophagaceae bacterium]
MATVKSIKGWFWWHRWTSLICTIFLLVLCITGLPLIFSEEIDQWLSKDPPYAEMPAGTPNASLDSMVNIAKQHYPKEFIGSIFIDDDEPQVLVTITPDMNADFKLSHTMQFDARTAKLLKDEPPIDKQPQTFIGLMLSLHTDMFAGLPGELFLGLMGLLFVISIISGIVLYGPFMKKLSFGTVRKERTRKLKWLDLHNLVGIATVAWLLIVGATGVMNELSTPLFGIWQMTDVKAMLDKYKDSHLPNNDKLSSIQAAYDTAKNNLSDKTIVSVIYPGSPFGSPYHYVIWTKGNQPFSSRLFNPVLVDASNGKLSAVVKMPVYLRALEVSRPLHFGDYGGIPLKILWAVFDIAAIFMLVSGIYLWIIHRKTKKAWLQNLSMDEILAEQKTVL